MESELSRPYAIHSATECERLERQAILARLPDHLSFISVPPHARILDAGCGSGSMARLLASANPTSRIVGVDVRHDYVAFARERAAREGLTNIEFQQGDIFHLPFPDASFDVVWSKYVLQWVKEPHLAIAEFRRVSKAGVRRMCELRRLCGNALARRACASARLGTSIQRSGGSIRRPQDGTDVQSSGSRGHQGRFRTGSSFHNCWCDRSGAEAKLGRAASGSTAVPSRDYWWGGAGQQLRPCLPGVPRPC